MLRDLLLPALIVALTLARVSVLQPRAYAATPTADEIASAIVDLGDDQFSLREAASKLLWRAGKLALPGLRGATKSTDPEVRARAQALIHEIRLGLAPDTSQEILSLVEGFQSLQTGYDRREAVRKLAAQKRWGTIYELLRTLPEVEDRRILLSTLTKDIQASIGEFIQQEKWEEAESALQVLVTSDANVLPQLLSFLLITDRLEAAIYDCQTRIAETHGGRRDDWIRLTYLFRAKGNVVAMLAAAEHTSDPIKQMYLHAEVGQWRTSAQLAEELYQVHLDHFETASWAATCYRLADDLPAYERMMPIVAEKARTDLAAANKAATENRVLVKDLRIAAKCMLVNERVDEGLSILRPIDPVFVHRIFCWQHRHREALEFTGITPDTKFDEQWLAGLPMPLPLEPVPPDYQFAFAAQVARHLRELGRTDQAVQIWKLLRDGEVPAADGVRKLSMLTLLAWQLGRDNDATRTAAEAMAAGATPATLTNLLSGRYSPLAQVWYERALAANPRVDRSLALSDALRMVLPMPRHGQPPANWPKTLTSVRESLNKLSTPAAKASRLVLMGHTAEIRGDETLARELFLEAATTDGRHAQQAGEMEAREGNWAAAAEHFASAARANPTNRIARFLWADSLLRAGNKEGGARQIRQIELEVIDPNARFTLAAQMAQQWLKQDFFRQHDIICRTALPISSRFANSSRDRGNALSSTEPEQAIKNWMQEMLHVLSPTSNLTEPEGYTAFTHLVHKTRARVAIAEGNRDVVERELDACDRIQPRDTRLANYILPRLRDNHMDDLADKLFERTFSAQVELCGAFPIAATMRNESAWLCARGQRKLDDALRLVERAIALEPDVAAFHDTLAEVQFQLGNRDAAIAAAHRCLELTGPTKQSQARLRHFSEGELRTLDGT